MIQRNNQVSPEFSYALKTNSIKENNREAKDERYELINGAAIITVKKC